MRRPHVYERSTTRAARGPRTEPSEDYGPAACAVFAAVPALLQEAEAAGAVALTRHLGQALSEAEGIVRWAPMVEGGPGFDMRPRELVP